MITALLLVCSQCALTSEAQYLKAKKGDVVPFPEAVITNLPTYRLETRKIRLAEQLIDSLVFEIGTLQKELGLARQLQTLTQREADAYREGYERTDRQLLELGKKHRELADINKRRNRIWNRKELWLILGGVAGVVLSR